MSVLFNYKVLQFLLFAFVVAIINDSEMRPVLFIIVCVFIDLISDLKDNCIFLSVENEGLRERIDTLRTALESLDRKYRRLMAEHSKCSKKCKIKFLHR
jgi:adenine-specific DNA methylase